MKPKYVVQVQTDDFTKAASTAFDYAFDGTSTFEGWEKPAIPSEFSLGLILGPSGSGKSLLLSQFGAETNPVWEPTKAIVSHFITPEDALDRLMAVGLNSIPSWCRPFHVLSNGEQFRANLARKLVNGAVIDEFTSVVDRNVAKAASVAMRRYINRNQLKNIVLASCHYDILDWLQPDWYFDTIDGILHDGRLLRRPTINLRIYPCQKNTWSLFAKHHYLTNAFNKSARAYLATAMFDGNETETIIGFTSAIQMPNGNILNAYREHRTVVFPDFQGLGLGPKISDMTAQILIDEGKRYFSRTAHPRFGSYRNRSSLWKKTKSYGKVRKQTDIARNIQNGAIVGDSRMCYSHEYVGQNPSCPSNSAG